MEYLLIFFKSIQFIKVCTGTVFRISETLCSGFLEKKIHGTARDNGAAPDLWLIVSIMLITYLCLKGLVYKQQTEISKVYFQLASLLYVDDTDLLVMNTRGEDTFEINKKHKHF